MTAIRILGQGSILSAILIGSSQLVFAATPLTFTLNPSADAFVSSFNNNSNYGGAGGLAVSGASTSNGEFQTLMMFNLASARSAFNTQFGLNNWAIQSAQLKWVATDDRNTIFNTTAAGSFQINWMSKDSWTEGTGQPKAPTTDGVTFSTIPSLITAATDQSLGTFNYDGTISGLKTYNLTLASGFAADLTAGGNVTLRLFAPSGSAAFVFNSENYTVSSSHPILSVTAVPEPGTLALGAVGLLLFGCRCILKTSKSES